MILVCIYISNCLLIVNSYLSDVRTVLLKRHVDQWHNDLRRVNGVNGNGRNKLRTYRLFKDHYQIENNCRLTLPFPHRSALAKFRCDVAPLRLETGRYENLPENEIVCPLCFSAHVLLECSTYLYDRNLLIEKANIVNCSCHSLNDTDKLKFLFTYPDMIRTIAKPGCNILQVRNNTLYNR